MFGQKLSKWTYDTGATGGVGAEILAVSGGKIILTDPSGEPQDFYYGGLGAGLTAQVKIPKSAGVIPKYLHPPHETSGAGSSTDFVSTGAVWMTSAFHGEELKRSDFVGATLYIDAGIGLIDGYSGTLMLLGMNAAHLSAARSTSMLQTAMMSTPLGQIMMLRQFFGSLGFPPIILEMRGFNVGTQVGVGVSLMLGYLHLPSHKQS